MRIFERCFIFKLINFGSKLIISEYNSKPAVYNGVLGKIKFSFKRILFQFNNKKENEKFP